MFTDKNGEFTTMGDVPSSQMGLPVLEANRFNYNKPQSTDTENK
jgi:hypothetical protein